MPLIDTSQGIESILSSAGLKPKEEPTLEGKIRNARLDTKSLLQGISDIASNGDSDNARLQALKMGLQLNPETRAAMNDEQGKQVPSFTIIIKDNASVSMNQILMPRREKSNIIEIDAHHEENVNV